MSMLNEGRPDTCGATIEGPIVKDGGRSRPLWRDRCRRKVRESGQRCWQHGGPRVTPDRAASESTEAGL